MPDKDINFLPNDVQKKRDIIKKAISNSKIEYTEAADDFNTKLKGKTPTKNSGFFSDIMSGIKKIFKKDKDKVIKAKGEDSKKSLKEKLDLIKDVENKKDDKLKNNEQGKEEKKDETPQPIKQESGAAKTAEPKPVQNDSDQQNLPSFLQDNQDNKEDVKKEEVSSAQESGLPSQVLSNKTEPNKPEQAGQNYNQQVVSPTGKSEDSPAKKPVKRESFGGVNLLSDEFSEILGGHDRRGFFIWSIIITLLFVSLLYLVIHLFQIRNINRASAVNQVNTELTEKIAEFDSLAAEDLEIGKKSLALDVLITGRMSWPVFLKNLESETIPEVAYLDIAATSAGTVIVNAVATNYESAARQITIFEEDTEWVKSVKVNSVSLLGQGGDEVGFEINIEADRKVFGI